MEVCLANGQNWIPAPHADIQMWGSSTSPPLMGCLRNKKPSEEAVLLDPAGTPGEERLRAGKL